MSELKRKNIQLDRFDSAKRLKLEEFFYDISADKVTLDDSVTTKNSYVEGKNNTIMKNYRKLFKSLKLNKRYKHNCKKNDATYFIKSVRQKVKESTKEKRFNLIQSFRSMRVSKIELTDSIKKENNSEPMNRLHSNFSEELKELTAPLCIKTKVQLKKKTSPLIKKSDESDRIKVCDEDLYTEIHLKKINNFDNKVCKNYDFDGSDSEIDDLRSPKICRKQSQVVESFTIKKNLELDGFIFQQNENEDLSDSDFYETGSDCNSNDSHCDYLDRICKKFGCSSDSDESLSDYDIETYYHRNIDCSE